MKCNVCMTTGSSLQFAFVWYPTPDDTTPEPSEKDGFKCPNCGSRDINSED